MENPPAPVNHSQIFTIGYMVVVSQIGFVGELFVAMLLPNQLFILSKMAEAVQQFHSLSANL